MRGATPRSRGTRCHSERTTGRLRAGSDEHRAGLARNPTLLDARGIGGRNAGELRARRRAGQSSPALCAGRLRPSLPAAEAAGTTPAKSPEKRDPPVPVAAASAAALQTITDTPRSRYAERGAELWQRASARNQYPCRLRGGTLRMEKSSRRRGNQGLVVQGP